MENSGFKVYKNFKTSQHMIDIYSVLPTTFGDFGVVVECNNYDKDFPVSIETLKHVEKVGISIKASKVVIITSSYFTEQATNYALKKNIKLVDRSDLLGLAKRYQEDNFILDREDYSDEDYYGDSDDIDYEEEGYGDYYVDDDFEYYDYDDYVYEDYYVESQRKSHPAIYQNSLYRREYEYEEDAGIFSSIKSRLDGYIGLSNNKKDSYSSRSSYPVNSLYRQNSNLPAVSKSSHSLDSNNSSLNVSRSTFTRLKPYLTNPIVLIILVVAITWLLSFIGGTVLKIDHVVISTLQILISLVLSYGLSYFFGDKSEAVIIRGTVIFFVSLIILIILVLL